jgi:hypothetical protein
MQKRLLIFLFLFNTVSLFGQNDYKQNLADLVSVTFPGKPAILDTLDFKSAQFIDATASYAVLSRELDPDKLLFSKNKLPEFYDRIVNGYVDAAQGKLTSKKLFELDGLKGVEIELIGTAKPNLPDLRFVQMIILNNTLVTVNFAASSQNRQTAEAAKRQFFNSLTITADKTTIHQGGDSAAYLTGYLMGKYAAWVIMLGGLAGVILLIRKFTRKRKTVP